MGIQAVYPPCGGTNCTNVSCINVEIIDDDNVEGDHQFQIQISGVNLGSISQSLSATNITINDNTGIILLHHMECCGLDYATDGVLVPSEPGVISEGSNNTQLCFFIETLGSVEVSFSIFLEVIDGSAGMAHLSVNMSDFQCVCVFCQMLILTTLSHH